MTTRQKARARPRPRESIVPRSPREAADDAYEAATRALARIEARRSRPRPPPAPGPDFAGSLGPDMPAEEAYGFESSFDRWAP